MEKISDILAQDKNLFGLVPAKSSVKAAAKQTKRSKSTKRDHNSELALAQEALFDKVVNYGIQRKTGENPELTQIATALVLCGLPYRKTTKFEFTRSSRAADGSTIRVTFYSVGTDKEGNRIPLAYGADRTPLHWCIDRAIKTGKPFVELASPSDFIRELGQGDSGANYKRIREAFNRIMSLCITVERFGNDGEQNRTIIPIIEHSHLPATLQPGATPIDGPLGFRLAPAFFAEAIKHHAPFPTSLLRDLATKPQAQDYILFLNWRSFAAKTTTVIPWKMLREQLWQDDTNAPRIRLRFEQAIHVLKIAWPELNAVATPKGLLIGPPQKGQHLFPAYGKETKRLS